MTNLHSATGTLVRAIFSIYGALQRGLGFDQVSKQHSCIERGSQEATADSRELELSTCYTASTLFPSGEANDEVTISLLER